MSDLDRENDKREPVKEQGEYTPSVATDFLRETIKQKPVNKRKLLRRTLTTIIMAVVFGMVACLTFLILQPVINNWLNPEPKAEIVEFPEEVDEVSLEEFYLDDDQMKRDEVLEIQESTAIDEAQKVQAMLDHLTLGLRDYESLYSALQALAKECEKSVVTVTSVTRNVDWINNTYQNEKRVSGVIVASNGRAFLVLVRDAGFETAEHISVTFCDGVEVNADYVGTDQCTGTAIISVPFMNMSVKTKEAVAVANLGSSNGIALKGTPVIALGSPSGMTGSINYGMIVSDSERLGLVDSDYKLLKTDIYGASGGTGILVNLKGYVVGLIDNKYNNEDTKNIISALGISELKRIIETISNGEPRAYLGIHGTDVPTWVQNELDVPKGAYVTSVELNSPAMSGGIQSGDVIIGVGEDTISNYRELLVRLYNASPESTFVVTVMRQAAEEYAQITLEITLDSIK